MILELGNSLVGLEIKSGETVHPEFFQGLERWLKLVGPEASKGAVIYGGNTSTQRNGIALMPWWQL